MPPEAIPFAVLDASSHPEGQEGPVGFTLRHTHDGEPRYRQRAQAAQVSHWLQAHGLDPQWLDVRPVPTGWQFALTLEAWQTLTPGFDTLGLKDRLVALGHSAELEIVVALLASPLPQWFPSFDELCAHVDVRKNICQAGRLTTLAFATQSAERPEAWWTYAEETGFTLKPRADLIEALTMATQPSRSGELFSFSCYRATEYVLLLGMARTLKVFNPDLLTQLQATWQRKAIASGRFHDTFLVELGSSEQPVPMRYYVPGDRVWFRNPDEASADAVGFEGSWVIYLGEGRFTDFWRPSSSYTMEAKCLEIYFWRDAVVTEANGELGIDEALVWARLAELETADASAQARKSEILARMMRYRDIRGVYADGGCIDSTREQPQCLCPGTTTISLPSRTDEAGSGTPVSAPLQQSVELGSVG